jgi:hypothetical protein
VAKIIDIFSKSIFSSVFYTTSFMKYFIQWRNFSTTSLPKLDPDWITGFSDAEGCFMINIIRNPKFKMGWYVQPCFCIVLHEKDRTTLELIKSYFPPPPPTPAGVGGGDKQGGEVGNITKNSKNCLQYRVTSLQDLINVIIPHPPPQPPRGVGGDKLLGGGGLISTLLLLKNGLISSYSNKLSIY